MRILGIVALSLMAALLLLGCGKPDPAQVEFRKKFLEEAILVKTCRPDPGIASGVPVRVYRFRGELWYDNRADLRRVDGTVENVCDLLDIEQKRS